MIACMRYVARFASLCIGVALLATGCKLPGFLGNLKIPDLTGTTIPKLPVNGPAQVYVVLFTHIEDGTPSGTLGDAVNRRQYLEQRDALLDMAQLAKSYNLQWVLQPDWKILEAARIYENATVMADTGGKNAFIYMRDDLGAVIDPHSHENGGYNYADVAQLLSILGVGGTTVIGGHIWDPTLDEFQEWDRFRSLLPGEHFAGTGWRGDILIGAGTPNHVNDPLVSGVWRPQDRNNFFVDDPSGNIVSVSAWHDEVDGVRELVNLHMNGTVSSDKMLTASWNINQLTEEGKMAEIETTVMQPMAALRDQGKVVVTDFTTLVNTWKGLYGGQAYLYQP